MEYSYTRSQMYSEAMYMTLAQDCLFTGQDGGLATYQLVKPEGRYDVLYEIDIDDGDSNNRERMRSEESLPASRNYAYAHFKEEPKLGIHGGKYRRS